MKIIAFPFWDELSTPLGKIIIKATQQHIHQIYFSEQPELSKSVNPNHLTIQCKEQLNKYFLGKQFKFNLPLQQDGTPFQQRVWEELLQITFGDTLSYTQLAQKIGDSNQVRAVANANAKNQMAIVIPCHRVIGNDGKLTGYAWGLNRKQWLLDFEGKQAGKKLSLF